MENVDLTAVGGDSIDCTLIVFHPSGDYSASICIDNGTMYGHIILTVYN